MIHYKPYNVSVWFVANCTVCKCMVSCYLYHLSVWSITIVYGLLLTVQYESVWLVASVWSVANCTSINFNLQ